MLVNILSTEIKERAIILTVETVGFLAHMGYNGKPACAYLPMSFVDFCRFLCNFFVFDHYFVLI